MDRPEKVATPFTAATVSVPERAPEDGLVPMASVTLAVLDVIDDGPGVAPHDRGRIFDSFYQGTARADGRVKGSGLGLAIAREYATLHGGLGTVRKVGRVALDATGKDELGIHGKVEDPQHLAQLPELQHQHSGSVPRDAVHQRDG